jgi:hypothetical protein
MAERSVQCASIGWNRCDSWAHTLSDNRHGLIASAMATAADGHAKREAAKAMIHDACQVACFRFEGVGVSNSLVFLFYSFSLGRVNAGVDLVPWLALRGCISVSGVASLGIVRVLSLPVSAYNRKESKRKNSGRT